MRITIPMLTPLIFFNLVLQMIFGFTVFTSAFIVSGGTGAPLDSVLLYSLYLYQKGFKDFQMGYAAAMAWALLLVIGVLHRDHLPLVVALGLLRDRRGECAVIALAQSAKVAAATLVSTVVYHAVVIAFGFVMLYPLLWMLASSFKPADQIFTQRACR